MPTATAPESLPIRADESYTLPEFLRRARMGRWAYRQARRNGLKVIPTAGRVYVTGAAWLEYLASQSR